MTTEGSVDEAKAAGPAMRAYAQARVCFYYENWSLPAPTQLLRHGFMQEVPNLVVGQMKGLGEASLAHADYAYEGHTDIKRRFFTLVYAAAPGGAPFAVRMLCHDRDLSDLDVSNPDSERQVVELDDAAVRLESDAFGKRYSLSTDHDQDQVRVWQVFDPDMVDWLTMKAPDDFSFELQDGALCCFVPGIVSEATALDALVAAAARVYERVGEITAGGGATPQGAQPPAPGTREDIVDRALAEHPFTEPPASVKKAARALGRGPFISDDAWRLGAEAFFRLYAESIGMKRIDDAEFTASHLEASVPGAMTAVAAGTLREANVDGYLMLTSDEDYGDLGWMALVVDLPPGSNTFTFATMPEVDTAKKDDNIDLSANGRSVMMWKPDDGLHKRDRKALDEFLAKAEPLLAKIVAASVPK
jgi:hypothetical protein